MLGISAAAAALAAAGSARWCWWKERRGGLPVLAFRKIGEPPAGSRLKDSWLPPEKFRARLSGLLAGGYAPLFFSDLLAPGGGKKLPGRPVLLTFEGAYETTYLRAFPILRDLGVKANMLVTVDGIGKADLWKDPSEEPWINMADLEALREMRDSGLVEFGSLGMTHADLEKLPPGDAFWEMAESRRRLEKTLDREIRAFAYPGGAGAYSPEIRTLAVRAGYELDFSSRQGKAAWPRDGEPGPLDRIMVRRSDTALDLRLQLSRGVSRLF